MNHGWCQDITVSSIHHQETLREGRARIAISWSPQVTFTLVTVAVALRSYPWNHGIRRSWCLFGAALWRQTHGAARDRAWCRRWLGVALPFRVIEPAAGFHASGPVQWLQAFSIRREWATFHDRQLYNRCEIRLVAPRASCAANPIHLQIARRNFAQHQDAVVLSG